MTKRRVVDHDVFFGHPVLIFQERFQDAVGGARVDVVGADQREAFDTDFVDQVLHRRNGLLIGGGTGVEDVLGRLFPFVLHRVEKQAIQLFHHRQHRFTGDGGPVTEDHIHFFLGQQLAGALGKQRPVRRGVNHHGF